MKSILVIFLFTMQPNGEFREVEVVTQEFSTEAECNNVGRNLRELFPLPPEVKTLSYCVSQKDFV